MLFVELERIIPPNEEIILSVIQDDEFAPKVFESILFDEALKIYPNGTVKLITRHVDNKILIKLVDQTFIS